MKNILVILLCTAILLLSGCTKVEENIDIKDENVQEIELFEADDAKYIGEYLDSDVNEPNLDIAKGDDGKYIVQIGIYRLTSLDDGIGELTEDGMLFTATDAMGNPISGIITVDEDVATVTITDTTWGLLENGSSFVYRKSSNEPNVWME